MANSAQITGGWILIILYSIAILYFVYRGMKRTRNMSDYAVGSVNFSPWLVGLSLAAAMTSAATFVINPGLIAAYGLSGLLSFGVFFPIASLVSLVILTKSFRRYGSSVQALTLAGWIGKRYGSKGYALFIAVLSVLLLTFIVLIMVAISRVISNAVNVNVLWILAGVTVFVFGYMMFGGANSMVYTNTIQAIIMIIVALLMISSGWEYLKDGLGPFFQKLAGIDPALEKATNPASPLFRSWFEIAFAQIIVGAAVVCQPHIITKSLLLKKESDVNKYLLSAVIIQALFYSVVVTGLYARITFPDMTLNGKALGVDGMIPTYVVHAFANGWISIMVGLVIIMGLLSAGLSTIEGLIQSVSSTITTDIIRPVFGKHVSNEKQYVSINRMVIAVMAIITFFMSRSQILHPNLSVAIFAQNGVYAFFSIAFVPIVFGIFIKNVSSKAALTGSITALIVYFLCYYGIPALVNHQFINLGAVNMYFTGATRNPAIAAAFAIVFSTLAGGMVHVFKKNNKLSSN